MTNHIHLLVTPNRADAIPRLIMALARRYVQYINTTYRRTGTLWDSRYKASLIQAQTYLLSCQCYIELNPVRAALVDDPAHYRWTSYRHHALGQASPYLTPHPLYLAIDRDDAKGRRLFVTCSVRSWTAKLSPPSGWRSIRISRWVIHASMPKSKP